MKELGRFEDVKVKTVWIDEDAFTSWLKDNFDYITEKIQNPFNVEKFDEHVDIGSYEADLLGHLEDSEDKIIVENQFGDTDHDHLGKLLTYMASKKAIIGIWIAETFNEEHKNALQMLNELSNGNTLFYGFELVVKKIGKSEPAPEFNLIVEPPSSNINPGFSKRDKILKIFFNNLISEFYKKNPEWKKRSSYKNWLLFTSNRRFLTFGWVFRQSPWRLSIELDINTPNKERNLEILELLEEEKKNIEKELGFEVNFVKKDVKYKQISTYFQIDKPATHLSEKEKDELVKWGAETMLIFHKTLNKYIDKCVPKDLTKI